MGIRNVGRVVESGLVWFLGSLWAAGCSASTASPESPPAVAASTLPWAHTGSSEITLQTPPNGEARLTDAAVPLRYQLHFDIDPSAAAFAGVTNIDVRLSRPTRRIDLHASKMEILEVTFRRAGSSHVIPARVEWGAETGIAVHLGEEVTGEGTLQLSYRAGLEEVPDSIYRVKEGNDWYVFSQLESQMAREAFPCFDEPRFKTPFDVTVTAPAGVTVLGNAPVKADGVVQAGSDKQTVTFESTKLMPTYLVALAVGPFERHAADLAGFGPDGNVLPHNIYTVRGKQALASYAAQITEPILRSLTRYLGAPYPYQKLDQIAVPNFHAGAMENVGLVTYRENILLLDAKLASERNRITARSIVAHELAHMWFGNLVTARWWDDIWLNEAFATWMSAKVLTEIAPELETPVWSVSNMLGVMQQDALTSARPIYKEITGSEDVENAFDGITYEKGFAILRMLENWLGPEVFQRAVREYLSDHAWKTTTKSDFIDALDAVTDEPVADVAAAFIMQAGIPLVEVKPECTPPSPSGSRVKVHLKQSRYVPLGAAPLSEPARSQTWAVPVCLTWINDAKAATPTTRSCTLMRGPEAHVEAPLEMCTTALYPNAGELGYYHVLLSGKELLELSLRHWSKLSVEERVGLPWHALALFESGHLDLATYVGVLRNVARDSHRLVLDGVVAGLDRLMRIASDSAERETVSRFASSLLTPHAQGLGRTAKPKEPQSQTLMRTSVLEALGRWAPDAQLKSEAARVAANFVAGRKNIDQEQLQLLLPIAAQSGDAVLHAALLAQLKTASPGVRVAVLVALGHFTDPELLQQSYAALLDGTVLPTERNFLFHGAMESEVLYAVFWGWYREHEATLIQRAGERTVSELPALAAFMCTPAGRDEARRHFGDVARYGAASETILREAMETADRCIALRERYSKDLVSGLNAR